MPKKNPRWFEERLKLIHAYITMKKPHTALRYLREVDDALEALAAESQAADEL